MSRDSGSIVQCYNLLNVIISHFHEFQPFSRKMFIRDRRLVLCDKLVKHVALCSVIIIPGAYLLVFEDIDYGEIGEPPPPQL